MHGTRCCRGVGARLALAGNCVRRCRRILGRRCCTRCCARAGRSSAAPGRRGRVAQGRASQAVAPEPRQARARAAAAADGRARGVWRAPAIVIEDAGVVWSWGGGGGSVFCRGPNGTLPASPPICARGVAAPRPPGPSTRLRAPWHPTVGRGAGVWRAGAARRAGAWRRGMEGGGGRGSQVGPRARRIRWRHRGQSEVARRFARGGCTQGPPPCRALVGPGVRDCYFSGPGAGPLAHPWPTYTEVEAIAEEALVAGALAAVGRRRARGARVAAAVGLGVAVDQRHRIHWAAGDKWEGGPS
jgi:hypothetical protein